MDNDLLMNQGDPGKRGADLRSAHPGSDSRKRSRTWSIVSGTWTGMLLLWIGIGGLIYAAHDSYGYWVGTATTAKVDHCEWGDDQYTTDGPHSMYCTGTWTVGGQSQQGSIRPAFVDNEANGVRSGSSLAVRVHDGTAFTAASLGTRFYLVVIVGPIFVVWGSISLWRAWRGHRRH